MQVYEKSYKACT